MQGGGRPLLRDPGSVVTYDELWTTRVTGEGFVERQNFRRNEDDFVLEPRKGRVTRTVKGVNEQQDEMTFKTNLER